MPDKHAVDHYDERELDELLDCALARYADAEPDPSLRTRIVARIDGAAPSLGRMWLLGLVAACAAALLVALLLHPGARPPLPQPPARPSIASAPESSTPVARDAIHPRAVLSAQRRRRSERPTLTHSDSFPSPSPLTSEENILVNFAAEHPDQARQVLTSTTQDRAPLDTKPLSIAPIHIAELTPLEPIESEK